MRLDHISFSSLKLFRNCKKAFHLHYTQKKKALPSEAMHAGTARHEQMAKYISGKEIEVSEKLSDFCTPFRVNIAEVEKEFQLSISGLDIVGYIDACYAESDGKVVHVVDWKSNKGMQDIEQLKLYALALQEENPFAEFFVCYFYFLEQDFYERHIFTAGDIDKYRLQIEKEVAEIQKMPDNPKATAGQHCKYCEFALECAEARKYDIAVVQTQEQAEELAKRLYMLESALSKGKALLEEYVRSGNEVVVGDHKWTLVQSKPAFKLKKLTKAEIEYYSSCSKIEQVEPKKIEKELDNILSKRRGYENITENKIDTPKAGIIPENESEAEKGKNIETNSNEMLGPRDRENKAEDIGSGIRIENDESNNCLTCHNNPCICEESASFEEFGELRKIWIEKLGKTKDDFEKDRKSFSKGSTKNSYKTYFEMKEYAEKIIKLMGGKK